MDAQTAAMIGRMEREEAEEAARREAEEEAILARVIGVRGGAQQLPIRADADERRDDERDWRRPGQ